MKFVFIFLLCHFLLSCRAIAQKVQTVLPNDSLMEGVAFQVQYIIHNPTEMLGIIPPVFDSLQLVSGPHYYTGTEIIQGKKESIENISYTLVPRFKGIIRISGITVQFKNNTDKKSEDLFLKVVDPPRASYKISSNLTDISLYSPPSHASLSNIVDSNIFIRTEVSRKYLYQGEPLVVRFILYSALQSSSQAIKAPGLYGFSMVDMLDINEPHLGVEKIKGRVFNTAILRQVQLYPILSGPLFIDPVHVENTIAMFEWPRVKQPVYIKKELLSEIIPVFVKALPSNQPDNYTGAVGNFNLTAFLKEDSIPLNYQGKLFVTIHGQGNFIQFGMPAVHPPRGIYFNENKISKTLNKIAVPEDGEITYELAFTADTAGEYCFQPILFSFFDPEAGIYKTVQSGTIKFVIIPKVAIQQSMAKKIEQLAFRKWWLFLPIGVAFMVLFFFIRQSIKKVQKEVATPQRNQDPKSQIEELYLEGCSEKEFFSGLQKIIAVYLEKSKGTLPADEREALSNILNECQLLLYSEIHVPGKKEELKGQTIQLLTKP